MKKLIVLSVFVCLFFSNCSPSEKDAIVVYQVVCDKPGFEVDFNAGTRVNKHIDTAETVWEYEYVGQSGEDVQIWAKSKNEDCEISVEIYYNGGVFANDVDEGDYPEVWIDGKLY